MSIVHGKIKSEPQGLPSSLVHFGKIVPEATKISSSKRQRIPLKRALRFSILETRLVPAVLRQQAFG